MSTSSAPRYRCVCCRQGAWPGGASGTRAVEAVFDGAGAANHASQAGELRCLARYGRRVDLLPYDEYIASLPRKRMSAGVLLHDGAGRVVLVEPSYKHHWDVPGGVVDEGESPWRAAARELREETGLQRTRMQLLVVDHVAAAADGMPEGIAWIFDGGVVTDDEVASTDLEDPEIHSVGLYCWEDVVAKVNPTLARQITVALDAVRAGSGPVLCADGVPE